MILGIDVAGGTLPGWLTLVVLIGVGYVIVRGGGGQALEILERANRVLTQRVTDLEAQLVDAKTKIDELEKTHTMEPIIEAIRSEVHESTGVMQAEHKAIMDGLTANTAALKTLETALQGLSIVIHANAA